jgi:hypothetical protein
MFGSLSGLFFANNTCQKSADECQYLHQRCDCSDAACLKRHDSRLPTDRLTLTVSESVAPLESHASIDRGSTATFSRPCSFHTSPGGCKKGARCTFSHLAPSTGGQLNPNLSSPAGPEPAHVAALGSVECDAENAVAPVNSPQVAAAAAETSIRPCSFHTSPGGCKKGARCTFSHIGPSGGIGMSAVADEISTLHISSHTHPPLL